MTKPSFFDRTVTIRTQEQMRERLAMRTNHGTGKLDPARNPDTDGGLADSKAGADPVRTLPLEWRPKIKGMEAILSDCGRYSVSRAAISGNFAYTAWIRLPEPRPIGEAVYALDLAKELCQDHADRQS